LGERVAHCKVYGLSAVLCANRLNQARRGWSGMPGHVGQNDTHFTLLQEELNAPISRPLRLNFAIGLFFDQLWGPQPLNSRGRGKREVAIDRSN